MGNSRVDSYLPPNKGTFIFFLQFLLCANDYGGTHGVSANRGETDHRSIGGNKI